MLELEAARRTRRRIRLLLLGGLASLLAILAGLGLYARRSLDALADDESKATRAFLRRAEQLQGAQKAFTEASSAVGRYLVEPNETALNRHRQTASRAWEQGIQFMQRYAAIAPNRRDLLEQFEHQRKLYRSAADEALLRAGRARTETGPQLQIGTLLPIRNELLGSLSDMSIQDRQDLMEAATSAAIATQREKLELWIALGVASLLSLAVAGFTFRHLMALEEVAAQQFDSAARTAVELGRLSSRLVNSQEQERRTIARDLHDDFGQRLASLIFEWSALSERPEVPATLRDRMSSTGERLGRIARDLQQVSRALHSAVLEKIGLPAAIRTDCEGLRERNQMTVNFQMEHVPRRLPAEIALALYRVSQEAIQNVVKHAHTERLDVSLRKLGPDLILQIQDFGCGFDAASQSGAGGLGMVSIRERLRMVGGSSSISSEPGRGTLVEARVPIPDEDSVPITQEESPEVRLP